MKTSLLSTLNVNVIRNVIATYIWFYLSETFKNIFFAIFYVVGLLLFQLRLSMYFKD